MSTFDPNFRLPLEVGLADLENIIETCKANLAAKGFVEPPQPMIMTQAGMVPFTGALPPNLPDLTDEQLGVLLGQLSAWAAYVGYHLSVTDMVSNVCKEQLEDTSANLRILYKLDEENRKRTEQERKDMMRIDSRFSKANVRYRYYDSYYEIVKSINEAAIQNYAAVSRRITQRGQDVERDRRSAAIGQSPPVFRRPG